MPERERVGLRPGDEARFVGTWGLLLEAGLAEPLLLDHLAQETATPPPLLELARACAAALRAGLPLGPVLDEHGTELTSWVGVLLATSPRKPEHLRAAAEHLLGEDDDDVLRERTWALLGFLLRAGAPPGEALGALARSAREREARPLAEALGAAARAARQGGHWLEALAAAQGVEAAERLVLSHAGQDGPAAVERLAALASLQRRAALGGAAEALQRIATAAQAGAAPLKRGLEGVISRIEGALGRGGKEETKTELAKRTVSSRAEGSSRAEAAPGMPAPVPPPAPVTEPKQPPAAARPGKKKTIGEDSGPVRVEDDA